MVLCRAVDMGVFEGEFQLTTKKTTLLQMITGNFLRENAIKFFLTM